MAGYQLSVCAEMVFLELPFVERVKRIHELGFGVEIWGWPARISMRWSRPVHALPL